MADELELRTAAYRKLDLDKTHFIQNNYNSENIISQRIENFYQENKEITMELIKVKDQLNAQLQKEIEFFKKNMD